MQAGSFALTDTALETRDHQGRAVGRIPLDTIRGIQLARAEPRLSGLETALFLVTGVMTLGWWPLLWAKLRRCDALIVETDAGPVVLPLGRTNAETVAQRLAHTGLPVVAFGRVVEAQRQRS